MFYYIEYKNLFIKTLSLEVKFNTNFELLSSYLKLTGIISEEDIFEMNSLSKNTVYSIDDFENPVIINSLDCYT